MGLVEYTYRYKYLGVMISSDRDFAVAEVKMATKKFRRRVSGMMRTNRHFNLGTRVEMANPHLWSDAFLHHG